MMLTSKVESSHHMGANTHSEMWVLHFPLQCNIRCWELLVNHSQPVTKKSSNIPIRSVRKSDWQESGCQCKPSENCFSVKYLQGADGSIPIPFGILFGCSHVDTEEDHLPELTEQIHACLNQLCSLQGVFRGKVRVRCLGCLSLWLGAVLK